MEMNEFQRQALQTAIYPQELRTIYPLIGITGETGEVAEKVKKVIRDRNGIFSKSDRLEIAKELGDVLWYLSVLANDLAIIDDTKTELTVRRNKIVDKHRDIQTKRGKS